MPLAALNGYLLALLAAAAGGRRRPAPVAATPGRLRFAVLVPARDEESSLGSTLASLRALEYPRERVEVIVIADNCSDRTADVARRGGATVWEHRGGQGGGKGAALAWGLGRLTAERPHADAVVLVDADCDVASNLLCAVEARLSTGASAVQVAYGVANPAASWTAALRYASFTLVNRVRPLGKARLGLSAGLFGTGMAFTRELLTRCPWTACSLLEDQEHHLGLVARGERVAFADETWVVSAMPTSLRQSSSQWLRWDAGRGRLVRRWMPCLLGDGLRRRDPAQVHAALEMLVPPQSLLFEANALGALLALRASRTIRALALANLLAQSVFVIGGLALVRAPASVWRALAFSPALAAWKLGLLAKLWGGRGPTSWTRTEREPLESRAVGFTAIRRAQLLLLSSPLVALYPALRRAWQLSRYALRRPVTHGPDFAGFARFGDRHGLFLDVGASSGTSAMSFRVFNRTSPIVSIEALPVLEPELRFLKRIVPRFDYLITAAGAERGTATMHVPFFRDVPLTGYAGASGAEVVSQRGGLREWLGHRLESPRFHLQTVEVRVLPLDDLDLRPDFVKIDVEGSELGVLRGLSATLERSRPILLVERTGAFEDMQRFLADRDYQPYRYRAEADRFVAFDPDSGAGNVFFLPAGALPRREGRRG